MNKMQVMRTIRELGDLSIGCLGGWVRHGVVSSARCVFGLHKLARQGWVAIGHREPYPL